MEVTRVEFDKYHPKDRGTCAEVSIVLDNSLIIHNVQVISGDKGMFIAMPNTGVTKIKDNKKRYSDIVHPTNKTLSEAIKAKVLDAYYNYEE